MVLLRDNSTSHIFDEHFNITDTEASWIASLMPLGALFGGPLGGVLNKRFGRKSSMFIASIGFAISFLFIVGAQNTSMLFLGRFLSGIFSGITSIVVPVYVAEIATVQLRGMLGTMFQLMVTMGILYIDALALIGSWRWMSVLCIFSSLIWAITLLKAPESPIYLISKRNIDDARQSLKVYYISLQLIIS